MLLSLVPIQWSNELILSLLIGPHSNIPLGSLGRFADTEIYGRREEVRIFDFGICCCAPIASSEVVQYPCYFKAEKEIHQDIYELRTSYDVHQPFDTTLALDDWASFTLNAYTNYDHSPSIHAAAAAGFPTRSLSPPGPKSSTNKANVLQIQIPPPRRSTTQLNSDETPSPTPLPGPESAPIHPFANSNAKLELLPPSSAGFGGIDIEEEARLYDELRRTAKLELPPVLPSNRRRIRRMSSPPPPSIRSSDIFLADNTGMSKSKSFAQDVSITGWSSVGDAPPTSAGMRKNLKAVAHGNGMLWFTPYLTGTTIHSLKRYTSFVELDNALRKTLPRHLTPSIPPLPPKNPLARFRPAFLDRRRRLLQFWLANVLLHPEIGGVEVVKKWVID
ncbi:hypothetical protein NP233_g7570 [Leucocoprinus birnbaumii]|uniref:Endosomal/vacuolar adapter protein YPT35 n=1 Tax=Leucocoprinus birnbaumii TaxID=56174 RepID=A0AAD5YNV9_9AGAR|nr:hypothetical protein NP233_g7570 [Leucocoprinus birnbaumii]